MLSNFQILAFSRCRINFFTRIGQPPFHRSALPSYSKAVTNFRAIFTSPARCTRTPTATRMRGREKLRKQVSRVAAGWCPPQADGGEVGLRKYKAPPFSHPSFRSIIQRGVTNPRLTPPTHPPRGSTTKFVSHRRAFARGFSPRIEKARVLVLRR